MKQDDNHKVFNPGPAVLDGLLFIPDISGFTELVHSTDGILPGRDRLP